MNEIIKNKNIPIADFNFHEYLMGTTWIANEDTVSL